MSDALRELLVFFGTEVDSRPLDAADKKTDNLASKVANLAVGIAAAFGLRELYEFVRGTTEAAEHIQALSDRLDIATDEIQKFQYALVVTGGDAEGAGQALTLFSKNLGEAAQGGASAQVFQKLGVTIRDAGGQIRPTSEIIGDVADGFARLQSGSERTAAAMTLFGRSGAQMIPLLKQGKDGVQALFTQFEKGGGLIDEGTIETLTKVNQTINGLSFSMRGLRAQIVAALGPSIIWLVNAFESGAAALGELAKKTTLVQTAMASLVALAVVGAIVWGALNIEFLLVAAAIAIVILVLDDLYAWWTGKDSFFGRVLDKIFGVGTSAEALRTAHEWWNKIKDAISTAYDWIVSFIAEIESLIGDAKDLDAKIEDAFDTTQLEIFSTKVANLRDMARELAKIVAGIAFPEIGALTTNPRDVATAAGAGASGLSGLFDRFKAAVPLLSGALPATAAPRGYAPQGPVTQTNHTEINVTGASDPQKTADTIGDRLSGAARDHLDDFVAMVGGG